MAISKTGAPVVQKPLVSGGGDVKTASRVDIDRIVVIASDAVEREEDEEEEEAKLA